MNSAAVNCWPESGLEAESAASHSIPRNTKQGLQILGVEATEHYTDVGSIFLLRNVWPGNQQMLIGDAATTDKQAKRK